MFGFQSSSAMQKWVCRTRKCINKGFTLRKFCSFGFGVVFLSFHQNLTCLLSRRKTKVARLFIFAFIFGEIPFTYLTLLETFGDYFIAGVLVIFPKNLYYDTTAFQSKCMMYFTHYFCRLEILPSGHSQLRMITYICMHLKVVLAKTDLLKFCKTDSENMLLKNTF